MKNALIIISHFKDAWNQLPEEEQAGLAVRIRRAAERAGVTPVVAYRLATPGAILDIWESDERAALDRFRTELDGLKYKLYFDAVMMYGDRAEQWIQKQA